MSTILVTGAVGFIGFHTARRLLARGDAVVGLDNIGNQQPVDLLEMISLVEQCLGRTTAKNLLPMQPGKVPETVADVDDLARDTGFRPCTPLKEGIARFIDWYREYYGVTQGIPRVCGLEIMPWACSGF